MSRMQSSPLLALATLTGLVLSCQVALCDEPKSEPPAPAAASPIDGGDTAWMLMSCGLVMLMVPGLALFYGGIARRKNLLGTMMQSMVALAIVGIQWVLVGYCIAFGSTQNGWFGWSPEFLGLQGIDPNTPFPGLKIPILVHCIYQGMFAIITPALISGAFAERIRFGPYCLFLLLWSTLIYAPLAHWVWAIGDVLQPDGTTAPGPVGWLGAMGALDFAGGTVVHIAAGFSGLAAILVLRKRIGYPEQAMHPSSMTLTLFGAGLLWFGWFGFNGGSATASNAQAGAALAATQIAAAAAALGWMLIEWCHRGKPTALGLATGLVAGLVAVTPAAGYVTPMGGLIIGFAAAGVCYVMVVLKPLFKYDDSLDAFGVHGIGGFLGALLTGILAAPLFHAKATGLDLLAPDKFIAPSLLTQLKAAAVAAGFAFFGTIILVKALDILCGGFCLTADDENTGSDQAVHGETAFDMGPSIGVPVGIGVEPKAASVPPQGKRFRAVVEGVDQGKLIDVWSELCQPQSAGPSADFQAIYPYVTTVQGNTFRFRGGDADTIKSSLERLFHPLANGSKTLKVRIEA